MAGLGVGCGADEEEGAPIPGELAAQLEAQLNSIQGRFDFPDGAACGDIAGGDDPNTTQVRNLIDSLPDDVDPDVRDALEQSFDRLFELVEQDCAEEPAQTETETEPTETETPTETTPTETVPTETVPTETIPTETLPTETVPPEEPSDGGDGDGGAGFGSEDGE